MTDPSHTALAAAQSAAASASSAATAAAHAANVIAEPTAEAIATVDLDAGSTFRVQQDARLSATIGLLPPSNGSDDTAAINAKLALGGRWQAVAGQTYKINPTAVAGSDGSNVGLRMTVANTQLDLTGAKLQSLASSSQRYAVIEVVATDCTIVGGEIVGDVGTHIGTLGEWGHGISIMEAAHRTKVERVRVTKCWGDGICIGDSGTAYTTGARPSDVQVNNVICDNNRRQGISVVSALRCRINGGSFINTGQTALTAPGAGIGIEANEGGLQTITDLIITGAVCTRNKGRGVYCNSATNEMTVTLNGVRSHDNDDDGFAFDHAAEVTLNGCAATENGVTAGASKDGFYVASTTSARVSFNGCTATRNKRMGFVTLSDDTVFAACAATENGWAGFASTGDRTAFTACRAAGNNQVSNFYGQFMLDGGTSAHLVGCVSEAGEGATKVGWGFQVSGHTGAQLSGCTAKGSFTAGAYLDSGTGTIALPKPGAAKQTGVAVTAAGIHAALVNLGLITA